MLRVSGVMPNRDMEYVVWYLTITEEDEENPDNPEDNYRQRRIGRLSLIDDYGVPLGLGEVNRNAGECVE